MSNYIKCATLFLTLLMAPALSGQPSKSCTSQERFVDSVERCVDISSEDIIAIGTLRIEAVRDESKVYLLDESRGKLELILTPSLVNALEESPADSFEVEGFLANGELVVKNLRPIE